MEIKDHYWKNKKVLITGQSGFKGSWLSLWLNMMKADVLGVSLKPPSKIYNFKLLKLDYLINNIHCDIRNIKKLSNIFREFKPEIVFHLAAQPLVIDSYKYPLETYSTNVMGTLNVLEAMRHTESVRTAIMITSDKCYENNEQIRGYKEDDPLGGHDLYSSSKGSCELLINSYRKSFFTKDKKYRKKISSVRAGNVIGGGDFGKDRLIPDAIRSIIDGHVLAIRQPNSIRPWQHVIEPLNGYLDLAKKLDTNNSIFDQAWNFGPDKKDIKTVETVIKKFSNKWGEGFNYNLKINNGPHEARLLNLNCSKAKKYIGWKPKWNLDKAINETVEWYKNYVEKNNLLELSKNQILEYYHAKE